MRLAEIVEGGHFEIVWSSEKPIRPEPYPNSCSGAAGNEFLADPFWGGTALDQTAGLKSDDAGHKFLSSPTPGQDENEPMPKNCPSQDRRQLGNYSQEWARNRRVARDCHIVSGVFTPVLAKHTKSFNLVDTLSVGVDRIQRNFEPPQRQVELWRKTQITGFAALPVCPRRMPVPPQE